MTEQSTTAHECPICTVVGLPILPLRYAVAWAGRDVPEIKRAPELSAPFDASSYPALATDQAHYTARLLRGGYLYVYDEARREWSAYEVVPSGHLYAFDIEEGPSAGEKPDNPAMCSRNALRSLSRCIQIKDAAKAGKVWLSHSDTQWTMEVKRRHDNADYRAKHMRSINVGAWFASKGEQAQAHVSSLTQVFERVSEYALAAADPAYFDKRSAEAASTHVGVTALASVQVIPQPAFMFSPYEFAAQPRSDFNGILWGESPATPSPRLPYAMVVLDDPIGVTSEMAALMNDRLEAFMTQPDRIRPMAVSSGIAQLREDVEYQAELKAIGDVEFHNLMATNDYVAMRVGETARTPLELGPADLLQARANAWSKERYLEKYDEAARAEWMNKHASELEALDAAVIAPLAGVHVKLLQSTGLQLHLECNYDTGDLESGAGYLAAIISCIAETQDKAPQAALYQRWFESSPQQKDNLLLRAFALNQDKFANEMVAAADSVVDLKAAALPWDRLFGLYDIASQALGQSKLDAFMAPLIKQTLGPVARTLARVGDSAPKLYGLVAWGMVTDLPLHWYPVNGTSDEIVRGVMLAFQRELGVRKGTGTVRAELRRLQIYGVNARQRVTTGFIGLRRDGTLTTRARLNVQQMDFLNGKLANWRATINTNVRAGVGGSLLMSLAAFGLYKSATQGMQHQREESWRRFGVATTGVVAMAVESAGAAMENLSNLSPRYARYTKMWGAVRLIGKVVGVLASVLMAILDFLKAGEEMKEGNVSVASAYVISGVAGAVLAVAIAFSAVFIAVVALIFLVLASIFIMWNSDDDRHDWLERCLWGKLKEQRYPGVEVEMNEFKIAKGI